LASSNQPGNQDKGVRLLNPWIDMDLHTDWGDNLNKTYIFLNNLIENWKHCCNRWFCLVIPLRSKEQLNRKAPIFENYPTIEDVFPPERIQEITSFMPLLKTLEIVEIWSFEKNNFIKQHTFKMISGNRRKFPDLLHNEINKISGRFDLNNNDYRKIRFAGNESYRSDAIFLDLKKNEMWPKNNNLDKETGEEKYEPEDLEPHSAVIFSAIQSKDSSNKLVIRHASYLPLVKIQSEISVDGDTAFELLLHGQFFLDSGRKEIFSINDDVKNEWNKQLLTKGIYPLFLPSLEIFVRELQLDFSQIVQLTNAIKNSHWYEKNRKELCKNFQWACCISNNQNSWKQIPSQEKIFKLPVKDNDKKMPYNVFPALSELNKSITFDDCPCLSLKPPCCFIEDEKILEKVIASIEPETFINNPRMSYLVYFFTKQKQSLPLSISWQLCQKIKASIKIIGVEKIQEYVEQFKDITDFIHNQHLISIPSDGLDKYSRNIFNKFLSIPVDPLVLPSHLINTKKQNGELSLEVSNIIINAFIHFDIPDREKSILALRIIEKTKGNKKEKQQKLGDYKLFLCIRYDNKKEYLKSWNDLDTHLKERELFTGGSSYITPIQKALNDRYFYRLKELSNIKPFVILFDGNAPSCNKHACFDILSKVPHLNEIESRKDLLKELQGKPDEINLSEYLMTMRYLLHGQRDLFDDIETSLLKKPYVEDDQLLEKIAQKAMKQKNEEWRWLHSELANCLSDDLSNELNIRHLDFRSLEDILNEFDDLEWLSELDLPSDQRRKLLNKIEDDTLWQNMPFHTDIHDNRLCLKNSFYYEVENFKIPETIKNIVVIIKKETEPLHYKYKKILNPFNSEAVIKVAFEQKDPVHFWKEILEALNINKQNIKSFEPGTIKQLKETKWLMTDKGPIAPKDIIFLPEITNELHYLLSDPDLEGVFFCVDHIDEKVKSNKGFQVVKKELFPSKKESVEFLGMCLSGKENYQIGNLSILQDEPDEIQTFINALKNSSSELFPVYNILKSILINYQHHLDLLIENLTGNINYDRIIDCLVFLNEKRVREYDQKKIQKVFNWYLDILINNTKFDIYDLRKIKLLNALGEWKPPEKLCFESEGLDEKYLLNNEQKRILKGVVTKQSEEMRVPEQDHQETSISIEQYFKKFDGYIPKQVVGGFLALMGNSEDIKKLAEEYLYPRTVNTLRNEVDWVELKSAASHIVKPDGGQEDIHQTMQKQRFQIDFKSENDSYIVLNLLGEQFSAEISKNFKSIFIGSFDRCKIKGYRCTKISFRLVEDSDLESKPLMNIFFESARVLLSKLYSREPSNLNQIWEKLSQTNQFLLTIVQHIILDNAFLYFKQLGNQHLPGLVGILNKWRQYKHEKVEIEHSENTDDKDIKEKIKEIRKELKERIESDSEIQKETLNAVCAKMTQEFQYSEKSVLFELFQNSDDASVELDEMLNRTDNDLKNIAITYDSDSVYWTHWGRQINEFVRGHCSYEEGKDRGYDLDLENMLFLSSSLKGQGNRDTMVTGKYGLGFKSVFILSDEPRILSGQLGFKVVGGFFPARLADEEKKLLETKLNEFGKKQAKNGTIFELRRKNDCTESIQNIMEHFKKRLPVLLIFSRIIKQCKIRAKDQEELSFQWCEKLVLDIKTLFTGKVQLDNQSEASHVIVFRGKGASAIILCIGATGVEKLPEQIPTFWVTAPTHEQLNVGFAVNAPFKIDIGRSQLAWNNDENLEIAEKLGIAFGKALLDMFNHSLDQWPQFCKNIGLIEEDTSHYQFWKSVWIIFGQEFSLSGSQQKTILQRLLWHHNCGMAFFLKNSKVLPTCLTEDFECLTHLNDIRYCVKGFLDKKPDIFKEISKWDVFDQRSLKPGELVSYDRVGKPLMDLFPDSWKIESLELKRIIEWHFDNNHYRIDSVLANTFGNVITRKFLDRMEKETPKELEALKQLLESIEFKSIDGNYSYARKLIVLGSEEEETMRACFAPDHCVLHSDYKEEAIDFFKACRSQMTANSRQLVSWILDATQKDKRSAAIQYILKGELHNEVIKQLKDNGLPEWIEVMKNSNTSSYLTELEEDKQITLIGLIGGTRDHIIGSNENTVSPITKPDPILNRIYTWWQKNSKKEIQQYEKSLYVNGKFPNIQQKDDRKERIEWLKLFLHGILHTVGRSRLETSRNFVQMCINRNWLINLENVSQKPDEWLKKLHKYIDEQLHEIKFFTSMKQLLGLYIIAKNLDEYIDAFLSIDRIQEPFLLNKITNTRTSELFQGGGPDAPPVSQVLGIGAWFIMRELVRNDIINNPLAYRHCYVPTKRIRDFVTKIGGPDLEGLGRDDQSIEIHKFLEQYLGPEKSTFSKSFDIISSSDKLWEKFFKERPPDIPEDEE
jgi:hypothetical protein